MKKIFSILLSVVMLFAVCSATTVYAAKNPIYSPETTVKHIDITVTLNGETSQNTDFTPDEDNDKVITFTYTGDGILIGWDFDYNEYELIEGVDYIILSQDENSITIQILDSFKGTNFWVNAVDKYPDETTKPSKTTKKNVSQKSPDTGVAGIGAGLVLAGAAILITTKKKN